MPSRHETVKLRSRNRHVAVTSLQRPAPPALWQLNLGNERLLREEEPLALPPKVFAILRYLDEHPGRLVTKQELLDAVWPDIAVTEAVLKNCILKLREVLGDDAKTPRYIETVHRWGYRLLAPLSS
jgi:DNA-binding winged helix-turn-helix (wHTH) protein